MVKKTKSSANPAAAGDAPLGAAIKDSAQQIWLAGLGAFAKAQEEGNKVFDALVKEGKGLQKRTRSQAEDAMGKVSGLVSGRVGKVAGDLGSKATESWDRLEQVFEDRVSRALNRLGVPTQADVDALSAKVDALARAVKGVGTTRAPRAAAKAPAKKAAAGTNTRRATAAPKAAKAAKARPTRPTAARKPAARKAAAAPANTAPAPTATE